MNKIKSLDDLRKLQQNLKQAMDMREKSESPESITQIRVAMATCGIAAGATKVMNVLLEKIQDANIPAIVTQTGCMGYCYAEPTVEVRKPGKEPIIFGNVNDKVAVEILEKYVLKGDLIDGIIPANYKEINDK